MKNKLIFSFGILIVLVSIGFISASGLCMGGDGYYHDCDDSRYFNDYYNNYDNYYYYHGNYYPTSNYYYRDYYRPRCSRLSCNEDGLTYKDTEEYSRIIIYDYQDRGVSENIKYTINEKTETNLKYDSYYLRNNPLILNSNNNQNQNTNQNIDYWYNSLYAGDHPIKYSNSWYQN